MNKMSMPKFLFFCCLLTISFSSANAQETPPSDNANQTQRPNTRPNLLRELGLTREQMQEIRRLNAEKKIQVEEAQRRAAEARRNLDAAIYADDSNDADVKMRLQEFLAAQSEVIKIRSSVEYEIRKILTPDQVARFRELRQRFADTARERIQQRRENRPPNQRSLQPRRFNKRTPVNPVN